LFSEISKTWAGCPLRSYDLMLGYIRDMKTQTGLTVEIKRKQDAEKKSEKEKEGKEE